MKRFTGLLVLAAGCGLAQQAPVKLTLPEAEALAVKNHPAVSAALLTALAANQVTTEVRSAYYPTVVGSVTTAGAMDNSRLAAGALNNPVIYGRLASGMTISQVLTDFGRTKDLVANAREKATAQQDNAVATRAEILLQVDRAYYAALRTRTVLTVARDTISERQTVADQVTALANSKLKSSLDVSFANVNLAQAKLLLVSAQNEAEAAMAELSEALGYPGPQKFDLADTVMPPELNANLPALIAEGLQNRPEVAALRASAQAAESFAKAEHALSFPTVSALASVGVIPLHVEQLGNHYGALGFNLNVPVFNGHLYAARRSEAELQAQAAQKNVADLQNRVARDIQVALLNVNTAHDRLSLTADLLNEAGQALDLAQTRYNLGLSSIVELSQAQLNHTSAQIAEATARYDYQLQRAVLAYQLGEKK
ncbi:MAG TPA: TolC family protein [Bryobacteraceae bacterium]|nr:TolC family protein [Bryobacteraceae bacterium]